VTRKLTLQEVAVFDRVLYVGPTLGTATPYKRTRKGWQQFYWTSFRAFGEALTDAQVVEQGAWS
jgi:hypothetical protein